MVRRVRLSGAEIETSAIGFGCASLGSRVSRSQGLRALGTAFEAGVRWYDVAPPYGAGEAEEILGEFVKGRRDQLQICTKVGLAPPSRNGLMKAVYGLARPVVGMAGGLRKKFRKMPATRNQKLPLDPAMIAASLDQSLSRLRTDYVDVFSLHNPSPEDLSRDDVLKALETAVTSGKARALGVAGKYDAAEIAVLGTAFNVAQLADDPVEDPLPALVAKATRPIGFVTHSILGVAGTKDRLLEKLAGDAAAVAELQAAGYSGTLDHMIADLLVDRALASNASGVVLTSMFSPAHQKSNIARASAPIRPETIALTKQLFAR